MNNRNNYTVEVVGTSYTNAKKILSNVVRDYGGLWNVGGWNEHELELYLIPEPDNEFDSNAISVVSKYPTPDRARISRSGKIGYLPKNIGLKLTQETKVPVIVKEGFGDFYVKIDLKKIL